MDFGADNTGGPAGTRFSLTPDQTLIAVEAGVNVRVTFAIASFEVTGPALPPTAVGIKVAVYNSSMTELFAAYGTNIGDYPNDTAVVTPPPMTTPVQIPAGGGFIGITLTNSSGQTLTINEGTSVTIEWSHTA
jgi:hypothetical protein